MIHVPPTIPQARAVLAHYNKGYDIRITGCRRNRRNVTCTGKQSMCVYHGPRCVPVSPVRYTFRLWWQNNRIMVSTYFVMEGIEQMSAGT